MGVKFCLEKKKLVKMLRIKRVPTVVSNYQKEEADEAARHVSGCGKNCQKSCCIQGINFLFFGLHVLINMKKTLTLVLKICGGFHIKKISF